MIPKKLVVNIVVEVDDDSNDNGGSHVKIEMMVGDVVIRRKSETSTARQT